MSKIDQIEQQRQQAIDTLEISDGFVKCQRCGSAKKLGPKYIRSFKNDRIAVLERRITWLKQHYYHYTEDHEEIKAIRRELIPLLKEDAKADKLRNIPLYSCRATNYRFVCGSCFDICYKRRR